MAQKDQLQAEINHLRHQIDEKRDMLSAMDNTSRRSMENVIAGLERQLRNYEDEIRRM